MTSDEPVKETPKTVLILKSNPLSLQSAEQFLISRGLAVMSTTNLTDSVQFLFENKIDFFILCANHPQKKIRQFPKLFKQFTDLQFITYIDMANTPNMAILQEMGIPFQVLPPVSGPAIERMIFRIEKEIKINKDSTKKNYLLDPKNIAAQQLARDSIKNFIDSNDENQTIPKIEADGTTVGHESSSVESFSDYESRVKNQRMNQSSKKEDDYPFLMNIDNSEKKSSQNKPSPEFQKKIEDIIDSSVKTSPSNQAVEKLDRAQNCMCFRLESASFRGFLVAAMGKSRKLDDELLSTIQAKLVETLQQDGLKIDDNKPLDVKIRSVNFEDWAIEKAEFLKKTIHDGNEVAMAFFPANKISPILGSSQAQDMMSISIDDLVPETPVSFDVYVHLPANNKYLLYTPKNGMILSSQMNRLREKGIDKMHAKKDSVEEIKKYHAENSLNNSIIDFENKNNIKKKKAE